MDINLSIGEIVGLLENAHCAVDPSVTIKRISSLEGAGPQDLAVLLGRGDQSVFDAIPLEKIKQTRAGVILAADEPVAGKSYLIVKDVLGAFQRLVQFVELQHSGRFSKILQSFTSRDWIFIDERATVASGVRFGQGCVVSAEARIGKNSFIGERVFVGRGCVIGSNVILHPGATVLDRCVVGDGTIIHAGAVIGSDGFGYQVTSQGLCKIPQIGIVRIGREVEIGANCSVDRASFDETVVEDRVKIDNNVHIAHNVRIGAGTAILAQTSIAGSVLIGRGCQIGGQVAIKDNIRIGNGVKIVSKSAVMNDLNDGEVVAGIPAMSFTRWKRMQVLMTKLPEMYKIIRKAGALVERQRRKKAWWNNFFT